MIETKRTLLVSTVLLGLGFMVSGCSSRPYSVPAPEPEKIHPVAIEQLETMSIEDTRIPEFRQKANKLVFEEFKDMEMTDVPVSKNEKVSPVNSGSKTGRFNALIQEYKKKVSY